MTTLLSVFITILFALSIVYFPDFVFLVLRKITKNERFIVIFENWFVWSYWFLCFCTIIFLVDNWLIILINV